MYTDSDFASVLAIAVVKLVTHVDSSSVNCRLEGSPLLRRALFSGALVSKARASHFFGGLLFPIHLVTVPF